MSRSDPDPACETDWEPSTRGLSYRFSKNQVLRACMQLDIDLVVRAHQVRARTILEDEIRPLVDEHDLRINEYEKWTKTYENFMQVVMDGYEFFADRHLITLFSAPNYCGEYQNQVSAQCSTNCSTIDCRPA